MDPEVPVENEFLELVNLDQQRRAEPATLAPWLTPAYLSGGSFHGNQERVVVAIARLNDVISRQDR